MWLLLSKLCVLYWALFSGTVEPLHTSFLCISTLVSLFHCVIVVCSLWKRRELVHTKYKCLCQDGCKNDTFVGFCGRKKNEKRDLPWSQFASNSHYCFKAKYHYLSYWRPLLINPIRKALTFLFFCVVFNVTRTALINELFGSQKAQQTSSSSQVSQLGLKLCSGWREQQARCNFCDKDCLSLLG